MWLVTDDDEENRGGTAVVEDEGGTGAGGIGGRAGTSWSFGCAKRASLGGERC
jgi:hypothetical protein